MLKGSLVYLRAMEPEDATLLYTWENDSGSWHVSNTLAPFSLQAIKDFVSSNQDIFASKQLRLMICLNDSDRPVGAVDLFDFDPFHLRAGVGILIANKDDRQKNYASEALTLLLNYAFKVLHLKQLYCNIGSDNEGSLRLFEKQGFHTCGTKRSWMKTHNGWMDEHMLQLLNDEV